MSRSPIELVAGAFKFVGELEAPHYLNDVVEGHPQSQQFAAALRRNGAEVIDLDALTIAMGDDGIAAAAVFERLVKRSIGTEAGP